MKTAACLSLLFLVSSCLLKPKLTGKVWNLVDVTSPATGNRIRQSWPAKVPADWTRLFFDSADAHRGYEALRNAFRADIAVSNTQNVFLLYKGILSQLRDKVYLDTSAIIIRAAPSRP